MMLDVHADGEGDVSDALLPYTHAASFAHSRRFFSQFDGMSMPALLVDTLLWGIESFPCDDGVDTQQNGSMRYSPFVPPTIKWAGLMILQRVGPIWILLTALSLAYLIWRLAVGRPMSIGKRFSWVLLTFLFGLFGLLAFLISRKKKNREVLAT
jgi:hypothetical protein